MTRQKKEIIKKIEEIEWVIHSEIALGYGYVPEDAHDSLYDEIYRLNEELAHLRHYANAEEMFDDECRNKHFDWGIDDYHSTDTK